MTRAEEAVHIFKKRFPDIKVYPSSLVEKEGSVLFMVQQNYNPYLIIAGESGFQFEGQKLEVSGSTFLKCSFTNENSAELRKQFPFTKPVLLGTSDSYGLGDRLGNAGAAHLKAIQKTHFKPVLAQQSIRELERTGRTAEDVLNAASRA